RVFSLWDEGGSQYLFCLDAQSGEEIWRFRIGNNFNDAWGNGPRATPIVDETIVYAISAQGLLHAINISNGQVLWLLDLEEEYGGELPIYGYSSSPLIEGDKLFVASGQKDDYAFLALDKNTGDLIWHSQTDELSYSSPIAITLGQQRQIVFLGDDGLFSVSPDDGKLFWHYSWNARCPSTNTPVNSITPIFISPDKLFISGGFGTVTGAAVFKINSQNNQYKTETIWNNRKMKNLINSSVFYENYIYGFDDKILKCIDPMNGEEKWKKRGFLRGSLIAVDGHLIILGERGNLALVKATPEKYSEISSSQIFNSDRCWTAPSLTKGKLYLRNHEEMVCLDLME
ncbi:MAG: PQQ-like beta-propeller repeat protein, partial [Thermoplasmatales archaeon]